ncbi:toxin-antitoxin system, toxin component [Streptomyces sp. CB01249]|uniref:DUF397 domain-containing protein n=1 Tax=Streptomyces sp. CB01249 TaxID=1703929 RepID=UPI000939FC00|nr:DUF397 domain-containing protein [Streptomyces sp. CB01249]OKJ00652.1 toxin-antitoxin system, toxin component [Streptomyces sp. CB01249]
MTNESPRWYKSSYSSNGGACVEVAANLAATSGSVPVRDSKQGGCGPNLSVSTNAFSSFVEGVRAGEFGRV